MQKLFYTIHLILISVFVFGQSPIIRSAPSRPKVGVVLSGGGAKGFADVGLLKMLEEKEIPVDYICGTSIGSIVGALYALGYDAETLEELIRTQNWNEILSDNVSRRYAPFEEKDANESYMMSFVLRDKKINLPSGALYGQNIMSLFSELSLGYHSDSLDFSTLPIPFFCIAADMITGEEVVLDKGFLPEAIRASMSIPTAFSPVAWNDTLRLVDGGIVNNFPTDICRQKGADIIIGSDIRFGLRTPDEVQSIRSVVNQMITLMGNEKGEANKTLCDVYVRPKIKDFTASSFDAKSADALIQRGKEAALEVENQLDSIKAVLELYNESYMQRPSKRVYTDADSIVITKFNVIGEYSGDKDNLLSNMKIEKGQKVSLKDITDGVKRVFGNNHYNYVQFRVLPAPEGTAELQLKVDEKIQSEINWAVRMDSDQDFSVVMNYTKRHNLAPGGLFSIDANIFGNSFVHARYSEDRGIKPGIYLDFNAGRREFNWAKGSNDYDYKLFHSGLAVGTHMLISNNVKFSVGAEVQYNNYYHLPSITDTMNVLEDWFINYEAEFSIDRLDRKYYPSHGWKFDTKFKVVTDDLSNIDGFRPTFILSGNWFTAIQFTDRFVMMPFANTRLLFDKSDSFSFKTRLGGRQQTDFLDIHVPFIGVPLMDVQLDNVFIGGSRFRLKFWDKTYISAVANVGFESSSNNVLRHAETVFHGDFFYGGGLEVSYDSFVGPLTSSLEFSSFDDTPFLGYSFGFRF